MMTTISTDGITIASDSQMTANDMVCNLNTQKLVRLPDGRAVGLAGDYGLIVPLIAALEAGTDISDYEGSLEDVAVLLIDGSSIIRAFEGNNHPIPVSAPYSIGSGCQVALGAMLAGETPAGAVRLAITRDVYSGGEVRTLRVKP